MKNIQYKTFDGDKLKGKTPEDVVKSMRVGSLFEANLTDAQYMKAVAKRVFEMSDTKIRTTNATVFLQDVIKHGMVIEIN